MKNNSFFRAFIYAFSGISESIRRERNLRFHLISALYVFYFSRFYAFSGTQWGVLFLIIGGIIAAELFNTAIEQTVDLFGTEYTEQGRLAKDAAAGAVLVLAVSSVFIGVALFWNKAVFHKIIAYHLANPLVLLLLLISVPAAYCFVFRPKIFRKK